MHDCINCGCACYCHGDIDDCQVETEEYAFMHCTGCGCDPEVLYEDDEEIPAPSSDKPPPVNSGHGNLDL